jgi:kinesin family member 11
MTTPPPRLSPRLYENRRTRRDAPAPRTVNVQVAVRCRPLNDREIKAGEHAALVCPADRDEVVLTRRQSGARHQAYAFDHVFGPESSQEEVYAKLLDPIVQDVLDGYNCTVFAYGQTGTGKTHTMQGTRESIACDIAASNRLGTTRTSSGGHAMQQLSAEAGMIPRAAQQVFAYLRSCTEEYSVRVSNLELYNEQLFDLLSSDQADDRLRMMEDTKGTMVLGLEDTIVRSEDEICVLLENSAFRRKTAETKLNRHSSRSHAVLTITVHRKENSPDGQELLKTGKLHLVDLAGSENISRSGAVKGQAREAGNINQSLLTLGRVITALVEKHPHVPYRDSKLTRLLQESLGGRNKTCLIATITAASSVFEETISTLDYAKRAKKITNRPILNAQISKAALLKELEDENIKLRKELDTQRTKDGVFTTPDEYKRLREQADEGIAMRGALKALQEKQEANAIAFQDTANILCNSIAAESQAALHALQTLSHAVEQTVAERCAAAEQLENKSAAQAASTTIEFTAAEDRQAVAIQDGKAMLQAARRDVQTFLSSMTSAVDKMRSLCHDTLQEQAPAVEALAASHSSTLQHIQQSIEQAHSKQTEAGQALQLEVEGQLSRNRDTLGALKSSMMDSMSSLFAEYAEKLAQQTSTIASAVEQHSAVQQANAELLHSTCSTRSTLAQKASEQAKAEIANSLGRLDGQLEVEATSLSNSARALARQVDGQLSTVDENLASIEAGRSDMACAVDVHMRGLSSLRLERIEQLKSEDKQVETVAQGGCESLSTTIVLHSDAVCEGLGLLGKELATQRCSAGKGEECGGEQASIVSLVSAVSGRLRQREKRARPVMPLVPYWGANKQAHGTEVLPSEKQQDERCGDQPHFKDRDGILQDLTDPVGRGGFQELSTLKDRESILQDVTNTVDSALRLHLTGNYHSSNETEVSGEAQSLKKPTGLKPPARRVVQSRRPPANLQ